MEQEGRAALLRFLGGPAETTDKRSAPTTVVAFHFSVPKGATSAIQSFPKTQAAWLAVARKNAGLLLALIEVVRHIRLARLAQGMPPGDHTVDRAQAPSDVV